MSHWGQKLGLCEDRTVLSNSFLFDALGDLETRRVGIVCWSNRFIFYVLERRMVVKFTTR